MALTLCVGFVVDDAIVMLENIMRHIEMGKRAMQATLDGSREIGFTIVSMTLSLAAVFIPVLFMGGILGRLLHEFAVTIMRRDADLGLRLADADADAVQPHPAPTSTTRKHGRVYAFSERVFDGVLRRLQALAGAGSCATSGLVLVAFAGVAICTGVLFAHDAERLPPDRGHRPDLRSSPRRAQDISFEAMSAHAAAGRRNRQARIRTSRRRCPPSAPAARSASLNAGRIFVALKPRNDSSQRRRGHAAAARPKLSQVPGIKAYLQNIPAIRIGGQITKSSYQYTLQGTDTDELYQWAPSIEEKLRRFPRCRT